MNRRTTLSPAEITGGKKYVITFSFSDLCCGLKCVSVAYLHTHCIVCVFYIYIYKYLYRGFQHMLLVVQLWVSWDIVFVEKLFVLN